MKTPLDMNKLKDDLIRDEGRVDEIYIDSLVNMIFNLGRTRLRGFRRMNIAISAGDWKEAAKEGRDSRWYFQVGNRAERLMTRMENFSE